MYEFNNKPKIPVNVKRRMNIFLLFFVVGFLVIAGRLVQIQILDSEKYIYVAKKQSQSRDIIIPPRGLIFDRNMNPLVSNQYKITVSADPFRIKSPDSVAAILSYIFKRDKNEYLALLDNKNSPNVFLERKSDLQDLNGLDTLKIDGLNIIKEPSRYYNYGSLASQIIGFTDMENKGVSGIELAFNKELTGKEGYLIMQKDGKGNKRPDLSYKQKEPVQGDNIVLTIDKNIQQFVEEELESGVKYFNADKGKVVVLSVKTGEILAMSSYPTFNPNSIKAEDTIGMKNSVISDIYEPGSTFKLITAAGILEENLLSENVIISTDNGSYTVYGMKITDSHTSPSMTFQQVIENSSNVGVSKLSQKLGTERFYKYARDFGIGIYSGVELRGENKGYLKRPVDFTPGSLEFMSIGYQVAVNLLQLSMAYASVANSGMLMKPMIVRKELSPAGQLVSENYPSNIRQVISQQTSKRLTQMFAGVVDRGTGTDARVKGVNVAGKTGTSQRIVQGEYSSSSHNSSFIGYFPVENPVILIAVVLDDPKSGEFYGGKVAAPVFQKIATKILNYAGNNVSTMDFLNVTFDKNLNQQNPGNMDNNGDSKIVPVLIDMDIDNAIDILKERKIKFEIENYIKKDRNAKYVIAEQFPKPDEKISGSEFPVVKLKVKEVSFSQSKTLKVPDVKSMSLRKAINKMVSEGFVVEIVGSGEVVDQIPKPGNEVLSKSKVILFCKNEL
ncbi:MAG: PASTA domain-containing protein [Ignavibacteriae bacterium]|nr:PASTA domain-containing protein [Ignavibacteriota bacterium]